MRIAYRPEIDGLRTVSVFAVIIYHANFVLFGNTLFQGGFFGVDIFFVISGYLITTLILKEVFKTNQFSFKYFYERRIRRILPVLLLVTIITSIISYFILLPLSFIDFGKSILSIIFFGSNFYFNYTGNFYGQENSLLKPLLHTWSLSVEEQFYILFPIFLIIIIRFFRKHLLTVLFLSFLISLLFSEYFSRFHPGTSFYQLPFRGFELLIGSLLSYFELNNIGKKRKSYSILNQICPSLGIILILYSFLFFNFTKIFHPSVITLIPLIGVSLIIWFSKKGELITEILSSKIFVFFGLISFSLYLWHYPIFAFLRYIDVFNELYWVKLLAVLLTIILSIISYYLIERPFRNKNIISIKTLTTYIFISIIILLSYSFYVIKTKGIKSRFPNIINEKLFESENGETGDFKKYNKKNGKLGDVLLIGNSHAASLKYYLSQELEKKSYSFFSNGCCETYFPNTNFFNGQKINNEKHFENINFVNTFLKQNKNLIFVWHERWTFKLLERHFDLKEDHHLYQKEEGRILESYYEPINIKTSSTEERQKYLKENMISVGNNILKSGNILILVYPVPEFGVDVPKYMSKIILKNYIFKNNKEIPIISTSYEVYKKRNQITFDILDNIQGPNVYRVYPHKSFCNTVIMNRCVANNKEHLFYYDEDHLSLEGSKYVVSDIMKAIQLIEVNKKINLNF
jgi:peptidoglycan/LPS O-acetylase OafA/YrhL